MLEVSVEQTILSEFILWSVSGGVTLSTIPYMTYEFLAKAHQTPSVSCGPPLRSLSRSPGVNPLYPPGVDSKRHDTYILLKVLFIHKELIRYLNGHHESVTYSFTGEPFRA
ncbi:transmembrane protein, putative [Medicago truncatula]|uniref:Transmembrane protein, putative n=1 Tax=Medicago truncatula TaxID=3880 RepID=G7IL44_MEDTR|nr:transmembrane protein, putative [Medicago truncatula]